LVTSAEKTAINQAISNIEATITSPNPLTVTIYFTTMNSGLGESTNGLDSVSYYNYYNAFKAVATSPSQLAALASLGTAPTSSTSGNPVDGDDSLYITTAEARNLGFTAPANVSAGGGVYDSEIEFNPADTSPPDALPGNYGLESVVLHEMDEVLGIGGSGSMLANGTTGPIGDLDLFRYSASGVRSYSTVQTTTPFTYLSIDGGKTVVSYFNQTSGADYGDWLSNPIPNGFNAQVQDAYGETGTNPTLGPNELTAFSAIGYELVAPEPSTMLLGGLALAFGYFIVRRRRVAV
jgi:hypothetical protein